MRWELSLLAFFKLISGLLNLTPHNGFLFWWSGEGVMWQLLVGQISHAMQIQLCGKVFWTLIPMIKVVSLTVHLYSHLSPLSSHESSGCNDISYNGVFMVVAPYFIGFIREATTHFMVAALLVTVVLHTVLTLLGASACISTRRKWVPNKESAPNKHGVLCIQMTILCITSSLTKSV